MLYDAKTTPKTANGEVVVTIHDVRNAVECKDTGKNILRRFLDPETTTGDRTRDLYQPDGSTRLRELPEKLRRLPRELLYDTIGLEVFEQMNQLEKEYYLARCEMSLLRENISEIADHIPDNTSIIDLGCGSMVKTMIIIDHLGKLGRRGIKVYGVDIDGSYLHTTLKNLVIEEQSRNTLDEFEIRYEGVLGTYDQSVEFVKSIEGPKAFLFIGCTIGNFTRADAIKFLNMFREETLTMDDSFFVGFDTRKDPAIIARAYNDSVGIFQKRMRDLIDHLNKLLGSKIFLHENFDPLSGYNSIEGSNERYYKSLRDQELLIPAPFSGHETESRKVHLHEGELIHILDSFKYSQAEIHELVSAAGLMVSSQWTDSEKMLKFCLLKKCQEEE